jgi:hypothetical protein
MVILALDPQLVRTLNWLSSVALLAVYKLCTMRSKFSDHSRLPCSPPDGPITPLMGTLGTPVSAHRSLASKHLI